MDYNRVVFVGRIGKKPEIKTSGNTKFARFPLAVGERWKDKATGETKDKTNWFNVTAFGANADVLEKYTDKGTRVLVEGRMTTSEYEKDGQKRFSTDAMAEKIIILESKSENQQNGQPNNTYQQGGSYNGGYQQQSYSQQAQSYRQPQQSHNSYTTAGSGYGNSGQAQGSFGGSLREDISGDFRPPTLDGYSGMGGVNEQPDIPF